MLRLSSLSKNKKGFEMQFNWLFVLIAGAIFIAFFFSLINGHSSDSLKENDVGVQQEIDSLLRSSQSSAEIQKIIPFDMQLRFSCYDSDVSSGLAGSFNSLVSEYYVGSSNSAVQYNYKVIFSPRLLDGKELIVKSSSFNLPFNVMPFVFIMNKDIEFVFVGNNSLVNQLYSALPPNATKKKAALSEFSNFPNNNYDNTVFIMNSSDGANAMSLLLSNFRLSSDRNRVYAVVINPVGGLADSYGDIRFFYYDSYGFQQEKISGFIGQELLLGAMVSHDSQLYDCQVKKAMLRANLSISLHKSKLEEYAAVFSDDCNQHYAQISSLLDESGAILGSNVVDFEKLFALVQGVDRLNTLMVQRTDCPPLY
jgi:hypothetical protein